MNIASRIGVLLAVVLAASTSAQQSFTVPSLQSLQGDKKMFAHWENDRRRRQAR